MIAADHHPYNHLPTLEETWLVPSAAVANLSPLWPTLKQTALERSVGFGLPHRHFNVSENEAVVWRIARDTIRSRVEMLNTRVHIPFIFKVTSTGAAMPLEYFDISSAHGHAETIDDLMSAGIRLSHVATSLHASGESARFSLTLMPAVLSHFLDAHLGTKLFETLGHENSDAQAQTSWLTFSKERSIGGFDSLWAFHPEGRVVLAADCTPTCAHCP